MHKIFSFIGSIFFSFSSLSGLIVVDELLVEGTEFEVKFAGIWPGLDVVADGASLDVAVAGASVEVEGDGVSLEVETDGISVSMIEAEGRFEAEFELDCPSDIMPL